MLQITLFLRFKFSSLGFYDKYSKLLISEIWLNERSSSITELNYSIPYRLVNSFF